MAQVAHVQELAPAPVSAPVLLLLLLHTPLFPWQWRRMAKQRRQGTAQHVSARPQQPGLCLCTTSPVNFHASTL